MNLQINREGDARILVLGEEMRMQNAVDFYQAILPLAGDDGGAIRVDAGATKSVHSSILQILYALSQAVPDFTFTAASGEFRAAEERAGLRFARSEGGGNTVAAGVP